MVDDFGTGKSFTIRQVARRLHASENGITPVLITLPRLDKGMDLVEAVVKAFRERGHSIAPHVVEFLLESGRIVLLLDGYDELASKTTFAQAANLVTKLLEVHGSVSAILSSRREHVGTDEELVGAMKKVMGSSFLFERDFVNLEPFGEDQIVDAVAARNPGFREDPAAARQDAAAFLQLLRGLPDLGELAKNPRLLVSLLAVRNQLPTAEDASFDNFNKAKIYKLLVEKAIEEGSSFLALEQATSATGNTAAAQPTLTTMQNWLWSAAATQLCKNEALNLDDLEACVDGQLGRNRNLDESKHWLGSRTVMVRTTDGFEFVHRSVAEFLVAEALIAALGRTAFSPVVSGKLQEFIRQTAISELTVEFLKMIGSEEELAQLVVAWNQFGATAKDNANKLPSKRQQMVLLDGQNRSSEDLSSEDWTGAQVAGGTYDDATMPKKMSHLAMTNTRAVGASFRNGDLRSSTITAGKLDRANFTGVEGSGLVIENTSLRYALLLWANDAELNNCDTFGSARRSLGLEIIDSKGHTGAVLSVAWSPDGQQLATCSTDKTVRVWDTPTGRCTNTLQAHTGAVWSVAWSPDGQQLATGSDDNTVRVWDTTTGRCTNTLQGHTGAVLSVAWSPDGQQLATSSTDNTVRVWDTTTGRCEVLLYAALSGWGALVPSNPPIYKLSGSVEGAFGFRSGCVRFEPEETEALTHFGVRRLELNEPLPSPLAN